MACECCGKEYKFLFPVRDRDSGFIEGLDYVCIECAQLVNDEYSCGVFRSLVSFTSLFIDPAADIRFCGLLVA